VSLRHFQNCNMLIINHFRNYGVEDEFDNPSVWCEDIKKLFAPLRMRLEVSTGETRVRKGLLHQIVLQSGKTAMMS